MDRLANDLARLGPAARRFLDLHQGLHIAGERQPAAAGGSLDVIDPSSAQVVASVAEGRAEDVARAVDAARTAFHDRAWGGLRPAERERLILRLADAIAAHADELSELESVESGRTLGATRALDVDLSVDYLRYMAGWVTKIHGKTVEVSTPYLPGQEFFAFTQREPIGVVGAITPWNVPLGQAVWKIAPALATGCTVVLKPAEQTPLTALRFADLALEAGLPPGVLNVVPGYGETAGRALTEHPGVDKLAFTGSSAVGRGIGETAGRRMLPHTLELGGKSPVVVMADADPEAAIPGAAWALFGNHGQNCLAGSRLYVQRPVYDRVLEGVRAIAEGIRLGPGLDAATEMGPLISREQQQRVLGHIEGGLEAGAELLTGGRALEHPGYYVEPTIFAGVSQDMALVREEIFGPVLVARPFDDAEEALALANDSPYGLGASVWTRDLATAHRFLRGLEAGTVWVNAHSVLDMAMPFGGFKDSGVGQELGEAAVHNHTRLKSGIVALG